MSKILTPPIITVKAYFRLLRAHQWLKNLLLFLPLLTAHRVNDLNALANLLLAFTSFCLCASAVYLLNDLSDLSSDRKHPTKQFRPLASATIPIKVAATLVPVLVVSSFLLGLKVGAFFCFWLACYFLLTCAYSLWLKSLAIVDCLTLGILYTIRVLAGAAAAGVAASTWLLLFSIAIFSSLAFLKRYVELGVLSKFGYNTAFGRNYVANDRALLKVLGLGAGYLSVLVLTLYPFGETVIPLYKNPKVLLFCPLLMIVWLNWIWKKAQRSEMTEDTILFTIRDKVSISVAIIIGLLFILAI